MIEELLAGDAIRISRKGSRTFVDCRWGGCFIRNGQDMLNLLAWGGEHATDLYLLRESNFSPEFYDLSTGIAGEILQKCSNYGIRMAIVGGFERVSSLRFRDLMVESNRASHVRFAARRREAVAWLVVSVTST
jgi:hypothetical protein